jgi:hypothetical protein
MTSKGGKPDVELGGSFRAAEVTFREASGIRVSTDPEQAIEDDDHIRENLPVNPSTGQVYRDVIVWRRVGARLGVVVGGEPSEGRTHGD